MVLRIKNLSTAEKQFNILLANNEKVRNKLIIDDFVNNRNKIRVRSKFRQNFKIANVLEKFPVQNQQVPCQAKDLLDKEFADAKAIVSQTQHILNKEDYVSLKWRSVKRSRYYNIYLQPTLFGNWSITKSWGGIRSNLGNYKTIFFETLKEAYAEIDKTFKQRKYRGYESVQAR